MYQHDEQIRRRAAEESAKDKSKAKATKDKEQEPVHASDGA